MRKVNNLKVYDMGQIVEPVKTCIRGSKCIRRFVTEKIYSAGNLRKLIAKKESQLEERIDREEEGIKDVGIEQMKKDIEELKNIEHVLSSI